MLQFPKNFFWGAATSAYQVEGGNANSDWWEWEKRVGLPEISGDACRHYDLYIQDFDLAKSLGHNCHRLSLEWSRIEPKPGVFSSKEISHYLDVILALRERGIEPVVTLHHFTNPLWFAAKGGWLCADASGDFTRYICEIVETLSRHVRFWVTINEPMVYVYHSYLLGNWPPQAKSLSCAQRVAQAMTRAHIRAYKIIHGIYNKRQLAPPCVSVAKNMQAFLPRWDEDKSRSYSLLRYLDRFAAALRGQLFNLNFIDALARHRALDYIGLNYYTRSVVQLKGLSLKNFLLDVAAFDFGSCKKNSLGWDIYPEGLYNILLRLKKYHLPVFILENGFCGDDDALRWDFIARHLNALHQAMGQGVDVLGYIYWSLIDNFEWDKGFGPRFGLVDVDYRTFKRTARPSGEKFSRVCSTGMLE